MIHPKCRSGRGFCSISNETGVETSSHYGVGGPLDDGAAVRKQRQLIGFAPELENKVTMADGPVRPQAFAHFCQIDGAVAFVDLNGITATKCNVRPAFASQVREFVTVAGRAAGAGLVGDDFGAVVLPHIEGQQSVAEVVGCSDQKLESFSGRDGGRQSHGRIQDSGSLAGFERALRRAGEYASQAGGLARQDVESHAVAADGCGIDPGKRILDREIVDQVPCLEIICTIEDEFDIFKQRSDVGWSQVGNARFDNDLGVESSDFARSGDGFGKRLCGVRLVEQRLPLQITGFYEVAIDDAKSTDAGACQQGSEYRPGGAASRDGYAGGGEPALALGADSAE